MDAPTKSPNSVHKADLRSQCSRKPIRPGPHKKYIGALNNWNLPFRFSDQVRRALREKATRKAFRQPVQRHVLP